MIEGRSSKREIFPLKRLKYKYVIHQMKDIFFLSTNIVKSDDKCKIRKWDLEKYFFYFNFLIVHISPKNVLDGLKFWVHVSSLQGNCVSDFCFMSYFLVLCKKTGNFYTFILILFHKFYRKLTITYIKNLRHSSLDSNM